MSKNHQSHSAFATLGLVWGDCTEEEVIKAYRKLALKYHPDRAGPDGLERMKAINDAKDKIMNKNLCAHRPSRDEPDIVFQKTTPFEDEVRKKPEYTAWEQFRSAQEQLERELPYETVFCRKMPQKMSTLRSTFLRDLEEHANPDRQEIWLPYWIRVQRLCNDIDEMLEEHSDTTERNHIFFSEVMTLTCTVGEMLEAIKHFKVAAAANHKEALSVYKRWGIVTVMGLAGWSAYEDGTGQGSHALEWWMSASMPDLQRKWNDCASMWSFEDLWARKLRQK